MTQLQTAAFLMPCARYLPAPHVLHCNLDKCTLLTHYCLAALQQAARLVLCMLDLSELAFRPLSDCRCNALGWVW